jgi:hypothetical protein
MKEVERKDLPEVTGGQTVPTNITIMPPNPPIIIPEPGNTDPGDPLGDGRTRPVQA